MNIIEACQPRKDNKKLLIKREGWYCFIEVKQGPLVIENLTEYHLTREDILSNDWKRYREPNRSTKKVRKS